MKNYSVLLLRPDYMTDNFGQDTYYAHVTASTPEGAIEAAKLDVLMADASKEGDKDDYAVLLVIEGHHENVSPE